MKMEEVKLYIIDTDVFLNIDIFNRIYQSLDTVRQQKIDRIKSDADKRRSLSAGYLLKVALDELAIPDNQRDLDYGKQGKPYLSLFPQIRFNISHSDRYVVMAINSNGMELGCDIEAHRDKKNLSSIARRIMADSEIESIGELTDIDKVEWRQKFYDIWTAKESYVKYTGKGLGTDFRKLEIIDNNGIIIIKDLDSEDYKYIIKCNVADDYSFSLCVPEKVNLVTKKIRLP